MKLKISIITITILILTIYLFKENYIAGQPMELIYKEKTITYSANEDLWTIVDSYKIKDRTSMEDILKEIEKNNPIVANRSIKDMINEWRAHNLLYNLHLFRKHTQTVDLERDQSRILKLIYKILSKIYF